MIQILQREGLFSYYYSFGSLFFRHDWANYFGDVEHIEVANSLSHDNISFSEDTSFYVLYCNFINQKPSGAITFEDSHDTTKILLEATNFDNCSSTKAGGSASFSFKGEIIQERICYHKSISSLNGHAFYSYSNSQNKQRKFLKYSSLFDCGDYARSDGCDISNGIIQLDNNNHSHNKARYTSGYHIFGGQEGSFIKYSSIVKQVIDTPNDLCDHSNGIYLVKQCNFIKNRHTHYTLGGIIYLFFCNIEIVECCIKENACNYIFYAHHKAVVTVKNCYLCNYKTTTTTAYDDAIIEIQSTDTNSNTKIIGFFAVGICLKMPRKSFLCHNYITQNRMYTLAYSLAVVET